MVYVIIHCNTTLLLEIRICAVFHITWSHMLQRDDLVKIGQYTVKRLRTFAHIPHVAVRHCDCLLCIHRDPVSGIRGGEVGLGRSRRDTYILPWRTVQNYSHVEYNFRIPDGKPAWVKMRVTNNGEFPFPYY